MHLVNRFRYEIVGAGFKAPHAIRGLIERGHHHDRQVGGRDVTLQASADLEAVHLWHHHVEKDDVAESPLAHRDSVGTAGSRQHIEIFRVEACFQQFSICGVVVDDQDTRSHRDTPRKWSIVSKNLATEMGFDR